jgi:hypothetical protein
MSSTPEYIRETSEPMDDYPLMLWMTESRKQATDYQCTWLRVTVKPTDGKAIYEGWVIKPDPEPDPAWAAEEVNEVIEVPPE